MVTIPIALLQEIIARAAERPDQEVCGLLFGTPDRIEAVVHAANVAACPRDTFEVDPQVLIAAMRAERAGGPRLVGHYHSHPGGLPSPSARDLAAAEPGRLWLIVGSGEARLWMAGEGRFRAMSLDAA